MGIDSTAILLRWLREPDSRNFPLQDLTVLTALTGDEFPDSARLVTTHILHHFRVAGIRFVLPTSCPPAPPCAAPAWFLEGCQPARLTSGGTTRNRLAEAVAVAVDELGVVIEAFGRMRLSEAYHRSLPPWWDAPLPSQHRPLPPLLPSAERHRLRCFGPRTGGSDDRGRLRRHVRPLI